MIFKKIYVNLRKIVVRLEGGLSARFLFGSEEEVLDDLKRVEEICREIGEWMGFEIVEVAFLPGHRGGILRVTIDKEGGVGINDCAAFSHQLDPRLDVEACFPGQAYTLEVSSPGVERPLKKLADFQKFKGKKVKIKTDREIQGQKVFRGVLLGEQEGVVRVRGEKREIDIPFERIKKAHLEFEWK